MKTRNLIALVVSCLVIAALTVLCFAGITGGKNVLVPAASNITRDDALKGNAVITLAVSAPEAFENAEETTEKDPSELFNETVELLQRRAALSAVADVTAAAQGKDHVRVELASDAADDINTVVSEMTVVNHITFTDPDGNVFMDGSHLINAGMQRDQNDTNSYIVYFFTDEEGKQMLADGTAALIGKTMSIKSDDTVLSQISVSEALEEGFCALSYSNLDAARSLAIALSAGHLEAKVDVVSKGAAEAAVTEPSYYTCLWALAIVTVLAAIALAVVYKGAGIGAGLSMILCMDLLMLFFGEVHYLRFGAASMFALAAVLALMTACCADLCARITAAAKTGALFGPAYKANALRALELCGIAIVLALGLQFFGKAPVMRFTSIFAIGAGIAFLVDVIAARLLVGWTAVK